MSGLRICSVFNWKISYNFIISSEFLGKLPEVKSELEYEGLTQNEADDLIEEVQSQLNSPNRGFINFKEKLPKKTWEEALTQISQLMQVRVFSFCQK